MQVFRCDICSKEGKLHPKQETIQEEIEVETSVVDSKGKLTVKKEKQLQPKMVKHKWFNSVTGKMEESNMVETRDLEPRAIVININVSGKVIQRDFCEDCYKETIQPHLRKVWDLLENTTPID